MKGLLGGLFKNKWRLFYLVLLGALVSSFILRNWVNVVWIVCVYSAVAVVAFMVIGPLLLPVTRKERGKLTEWLTFALTGDRLWSVVVRDGKVIAPLPDKNKKSKEAVEKTAPEGRGIVITDSTSVVVMRTETGIATVIGPGNSEEGKSESGIFFAYYPEQVDSVIDLRPQARTELIKAQTRDGIVVDVRITAFFTLKGTKARRSADMAQKNSTPHPFTWRQASVRESFHNRRVEYVAGKPDMQTQWSDRVMQIGIADLRQLIARHTLDFLTAPVLSDKHPRFEIRRELLGLVQQQLDTVDEGKRLGNGESGEELKRGSGIDVRFIAVSIIWPPPPVVQERIEAWKKEWKKKEVEVLGRAQADALIRKEKARANAQGELTARINDALKAAKDSGATSSDLVAMRFLEVMDKMAKDPTTRALLTLDSLNMLKQLRDMLKTDGQDKPV